MRTISRAISSQLRAEGFIKNGNAFFKTQGDGILITVNLERNGEWLLMPQYSLSFGLESLYSDIPPYELTGSGCVARYPVSCLFEKEEKQPTLQILKQNDEKQQEAIGEKLIPFLNQIMTQNQLLQCICYLEVIRRISSQHGKIRALLVS